jgi:hypothetical protein
MAKAGGQATEEKVGNATLLSSSRERETVLVLASGGAWLVISDRGGEPAMRHARRIAELGKEASLAGSARFGKALDALASGGHATVWVDTRALTAAYRSHLEERRAEPPVDPGDAEAAAREREWKARWEKRSEAEFALFDGLIGGFDAVAIGFDITGAGVRMKAWGGLREGSLLARGLKNGAGVPPVLRSLEARPLFAAAGAVDTAVAMEALALLARADGDELDEGLDEARRELGIDVRADLVGALDGRIGFAITGDLAKIMESGDDPERHFGGSLTLGVSDPAKVKATLDKLWAARGVSRLVTVAGPGERARIAVPRWRDVHVGVVGDVLLATTDPAAFERLGQEGRAGLIDAEAEGPAKDVLRAADPAAVMWYDHGLAALLLSAFRFDWDDGPIPLGEDATDAQKSAHAEYVAARNRANELKKQWQAVEDRAAREVTRRLGILAASARVEEGAVVVRAAQVMGADTLPNAAATIARTVVESQEQLDRLRREMWQAEDSANMLGRRLRDQRAAPEAVLEVPVEPSAAP